MKTGRSILSLIALQTARAQAAVISIDVDVSALSHVARRSAVENDPDGSHVRNSLSLQL